MDEMDFMDEMDTMDRGRNSWLAFGGSEATMTPLVQEMLS
jgi:hypothetical protein